MAVRAHLWNSAFRPFQIERHGPGRVPDPPVPKRSGPFFPSIDHPICRRSDELHFEWDVNEHFASGFSLGVGGYVYDQVTGDSGPATPNTRYSVHSRGGWWRSTLWSATHSRS